MDELPLASKRKVSRPVKLFFSAIYCDPKILIPFREIAIKDACEFSAEYGDFPFEHTDYYRGEMGEKLKRRLFFASLIPRSLLPRIKMLSREWEVKLSKDKKRLINIDPGFMTLEQVCLLTFKNYFHRFYLGYGVYGEITLFFRSGRFNAFQWTYPDYREEALIDVFNRERHVLKREYAAGGWL